MAFQCTIVTPEAQSFDQSVTQVILPAHDGQVGILTNRAPILVRLGVGPLHVDLAGGKSAHFFVEGGVAQMKDNKLTVLTHEAVSSADIKPDDARAALAKAEAIAGDDKATREKRAVAIKRAQAMIAVAGR